MSNRITLPINCPIPPKGGIMELNDRAYRVLGEKEVPAKAGELDGYSVDFFIIQVQLEDVTDTPEGQALLANGVARRAELAKVGLVF